MRDVDRPFYKYADTVAVTNGNTWTGDQILLFGTQALNVQCVASNGAAGTLYIDGSNQDGMACSYVSPSNVAVSANGSSTMNFSLTDAITSMRVCRLRFVPTASGNVRIDLNLRRTIA